MENEIYEESFHEFDELVAYLSTLPQATVKILNIKRYNQMLKTAIDLFNLLKETDPNIKIKIKINHMFNMGSVSVSADELTIYSPSAFYEIIKHADNFDIYPLTNGKIKLDVAFYRVLKSIA